jgi:hypothetical protein
MAMLFSLTQLSFAADHNQYEKRGHDKQQHDQRDHDKQGDRNDHQMPFRWGDHRNNFEGHHMEAIHDNKLERRYPGLRGYRWRGGGDYRGFWHNDRYVDDGIMFFDRNDRLSGFGYMADGVFVFLNEEGYHQDRDAFMFFLLLFQLFDQD